MVKSPKNAKKKKKVKNRAVNTLQKRYFFTIQDMKHESLIRPSVGNMYIWTQNFHCSAHIHKWLGQCSD